MTKKILFEVRELSTDPSFQVVEEEDGSAQTHFGATYASEADVRVGITTKKVGADFVLYAGTELLTLLSNVLAFTNGLSIGGGAIITKVLSAIATLDFPSIGANESVALTITVLGAQGGDIAVIAPPTTLEAGLVYVGRVSATDTVSVLLHNQSGGSINPASASWRALVISFV